MRRRGFNFWGCLLYLVIGVLSCIGLTALWWFKPWATEPPDQWRPAPAATASGTGAMVTPGGAGWSYRVPAGWTVVQTKPRSPLYLTAVAPPLKGKPGGRSSTAYVAVLALSKTSTHPDTRPQAGFYEAAQKGDLSKLGHGWSLATIDSAAGQVLQVDYQPPSGREPGTRYLFFTRPDRVIYMECQWVLAEDRADALAGCTHVSSSLAIND